jgi:hypothetical protein
MSLRLTLPVFGWKVRAENHMKELRSKCNGKTRKTFYEIEVQRRCGHWDEQDALRRNRGNQLELESSWKVKIMTTHTDTLNKLQIIGLLYRHGYRSDIIDRAIDELIAMEQRNALRELAEIDVRLRLFEGQYVMASEEFYKRFQEGELGDNADFFEWSACYDMARSIHERLQNLTTQPS